MTSALLVEVEATNVSSLDVYHKAAQPLETGRIGISNSSSRRSSTPGRRSNRVEDGPRSVTVAMAASRSRSIRSSNGGPSQIRSLRPRRWRRHHFTSMYPPEPSSGSAAGLTRGVGVLVRRVVVFLRHGESGYPVPTGNPALQSVHGLEGRVDQYRQTLPCVTSRFLRLAVRQASVPKGEMNRPFHVAVAILACSLDGGPGRAGFLSRSRAT